MIYPNRNFILTGPKTFIPDLDETVEQGSNNTNFDDYEYEENGKFIYKIFPPNEKIDIMEKTQIFKI